MKKTIKQLLFIAAGAVIIMVGILIIRASNNRGNEPYIYLKMNEGYGTTVYDSMDNNNASITGATWAEEDECRSGKCLYFDGSGDYLSLPDFDLE